MIFYHVSRPHPGHSTPADPSLVRACATTDAEQDGLTLLHPSWLKRPRPGESYQSDAYRARHSRSTAGPSIYVPPALHAEIPHALLISDSEISVTTDLRTLNRARWRRDFTPHHQGVPFNRVRHALESGLLTNPLLLHTVRQFLRVAPISMYAGRPLTESAEAFAPAPNPDPAPKSATGTRHPQGYRFDPATGEIL